MATKAKGKYYRKKIRHPVTGSYKDVYGKTRAELQEKIEAVERAWSLELMAGEDPPFFEYAAAWFSRVSGDMTVPRKAELAREINNNICPVIGALRLSEVTSDSCLDVMAGRAGKSRSAQARTLQTLKRILQAAEDSGVISRNPARSLKPGGAPAAPREALTKAQQQALLAAVEGRPVEAVVRLGLFAGLRREEILGLRWQDVHLDPPAHLDVRQACRWPSNNQPELSEKLKSKAARRTVPLPPPLRSFLASLWESAEKDAHGAPRGLTVVSDPDGRPWTYQTFRRAWGAIEARTAGEGRPLGSTVPKHPDVKITLDFPVTPHVLRHTYITELILGGVNVKRVQYLAGHESSKVTMDIYTHLMGNRPEDLIDDVSAVFPG